MSMDFAADKVIAAFLGGCDCAVCTKECFDALARAMSRKLVAMDMRNKSMIVDSLHATIGKAMDMDVRST